MFLRILPSAFFLQPGHLRLTDANLTGDLHLRLAGVKAQGEDLFFALVEFGDGV